MRLGKRLFFLLCLMLVSFSVSAQTHVFFDLNSFGASPVTNRSVTLQSLSPFPGNLRFFTSDSNGQFYFSNAPASLYQGYIKAPPAQIPFKLLVTATNLGTITAYPSYIVADATATFPAGNVAWAAVASDSRFIHPTNSPTSGFVAMYTNGNVRWESIGTIQGAASNTVSPGNSLTTVATNSANYAVSALSQTNGFSSLVFTNPTQIVMTNFLPSLVSTSSLPSLTNHFAMTNQSTPLSFTNILNQFVGTLTGPATEAAINSTEMQAILGVNGANKFTVTGISALLLGAFVSNSITSGTATNALNVTSGITNRWKIDATNAVYAIAYTNTIDAGSGLFASTGATPIITISVAQGTTNRFAFTNYVAAVSNNVVTASNALSIYGLGISNSVVTSSNALYTYVLGSSNRFNVLFPTNSGSDGQIVTKSGSNVYWSTVTGGSGTGIQTNSGTGTNNILINPVLMGQNLVPGDVDADTGFFSIAPIAGNFQAGISNSYDISGGTPTFWRGNTVFGKSNQLGGGSAQFIVGVSNIISSSDNGAVFGSRANNSATPNVFMFSDGRFFTSSVPQSFIVSVLNGFAINTNNPSGNALNVIGGGVSATNFNIQGDPFIYRSTNIVSVRDAGSIGVNGTYVYLGNQYTNYLTGGTITNNAGTWVILNAALQSAYSFTGTSPVSTNWTLGIGSPPSPRTFFGGYFDFRGFYGLGDFDQTNLAKIYLHPTNAPSDGQLVVASGNNSKWSSIAGITNISGNAATATVATNWLGGNIYVSPSGSDLASGAIGAPLASVSNAMTRIGGVGTVIVRGGNYFNQTFNLGNFQQIDARIVSYRGEKPSFWYGEQILPSSFGALSNNIFTNVMTTSFSNALVFWTNRWNANSPTGKWGCLFQTNTAAGTNRSQWAVPAVIDRLTETNRMEHNPIYHATSVANMVGAATNSLWFADGRILYVKFQGSTAGGLWIQGTNQNDSFCWGGAPPGSSISISGIRTYFGYTGFDLTGASEAKLTGCYSFGAGFCAYYAVNSANSIEYATNVYTGSVELFGCESACSQIFGFFVNGYDGAFSNGPWCQAKAIGCSFHDGMRESCSFWGNVNATVLSSVFAFNGVPNEMDLQCGSGPVSSASSVWVADSMSISNSRQGFQLGDPLARRSTMYVLNNRLYENSGTIVAEDFNDVLFSQNNAYYKILPNYNLISVDATATPFNYVEDSGSFAIILNAVNGLIIDGTGVPTANTVSNPRAEPDRLFAAKTMFLNGTVSPLGSTLGVLDMPSGFITIRGTGSSYFGGPIGLHTNAFSTWPIVGQVGGDSYIVNSNGWPTRLRSTPFSTTLANTNNF